MFVHTIYCSTNQQQTLSCRLLSNKTDYASRCIYTFQFLMFQILTWECWNLNLTLKKKRIIKWSYVDKRDIIYLCSLPTRRKKKKFFHLIHQGLIWKFQANYCYKKHSWNNEPLNNYSQTILKSFLVVKPRFRAIDRIHVDILNINFGSVILYSCFVQWLHRNVAFSFQNVNLWNSEKFVEFMVHSWDIFHVSR